MKPFTLIVATTLSLLGFVGAQSCAPSGTHLKSGEISCACNADGSVTCSGFELCGVGNINADVDLESQFTAMVQCRNKGGQIVDVKTQPVTDTDTIENLQSRNGCLTVPQLSTERPSNKEFEDRATCPNRNWSKELLGGTVLDTFTYSLTFEGFTCPFASASLSGQCSG